MICSGLPSVSRRPIVRHVSLDDDPFGGPTARLVSMWAPVHGLRLHALASAEAVPVGAPTVILVHGVAVSGRYLGPLAQRLAPYVRVWVPDLPGYGRSDRPRGRDLTVPELADALLAWMDRVGAGRPHLLGNSFGCQVIADLASRHPDRVGRLVLQGPTMDLRARSAWRQALRWLAVVPLERPSAGPVLLRDVWDLGPRRAADMIRMALHDPIERRLGRVVAPTLVVRGARDAIVPQRWAEDAARLLPHGRLVVIERAAHTINYSQPAWLARVVLPFLTDADPDDGLAQASVASGTDSHR
jgi:pimeloyl-ACP methyl ester carboxylesterase